MQEALDELEDELADLPPSNIKAGMRGKLARFMRF